MTAFCPCVDPAAMLEWRRALDLRNEALAQARADRRRVEDELATLRVAALHVVSTPPDTPYHRDAVGALRALLRGAGLDPGPERPPDPDSLPPLRRLHLDRPVGPEAGR